MAEFGRPSFDIALEFWRSLLEQRRLPTRLVWVFHEDHCRLLEGGVKLFAFRPHAAGAGAWIARRAYDALKADSPIVFAAYAHFENVTVTGLQGDFLDGDEDVRRPDWNLYFDATCHLQSCVSLIGDMAEWQRMKSREAPFPSELDYLLSGERFAVEPLDKTGLRIEALRDLLLLTSPLGAIMRSLAMFEWDSEELINLQPAHMAAALKRFHSGQLSADEVEAWANAVEMRDDIGYAADSVVGQVLHELANPMLTEPLAPRRADELLALLSTH